MATNYERAFEQRPEVYAAWQQLSGAIKAGMDLRRYELVTLAAAKRLRSSYCSLAHGTVLAERFDMPVDQIATDHRAAGLDEVDVAVMDLAEQVADDATSVSEANLQRLRDLGLSQDEIMDVILAAAAAAFSPRPSTPSVSSLIRAIATSSPAFARPSSSAARSPVAEHPAVMTRAGSPRDGRRARRPRRPDDQSGPRREYLPLQHCRADRPWAAEKPHPTSGN